ncbi:MAG TPA: hypothetical protein VG795_06790, partial [Acidimicrobiia bacterium]|nr:hypothetical protein [Acidimicrobiia bacterium]
AALSQALERGDATVDLVYRVPAQAKEAAAALKDMLEEADEFCRRGTDLLTLASPPRAVAFRNWFLDQFTIQIDGGQPTRWEG